MIHADVARGIAKSTVDSKRYRSELLTFYCALDRLIRDCAMDGNYSINIDLSQKLHEYSSDKEDMIVEFLSHNGYSVETESSEKDGVLYSSWITIRWD